MVLKNLLKIYYVIKSVHNPFKTIIFLSKYRNNSLLHDNITFKNNITIKDVTPGSLWALITYYYWSHKLSIYSSEDLLDIATIGTDVDKKLLENLGSDCGSFKSIQGKDGILYMLIRKYQPDICIETGISSGFSTYYILSALERNGKGNLISIDIIDEVAICQKKFLAGWLVPENLKNRWKKVIESSDTALHSVPGKIDFFVHDSLHSANYMLNEYSWALRHLNKNGVLASDDIDWNNAWKKFLNSNNNLIELVATPTFAAATKSE